jgi:DNA-binding SARP family transcriptional activator
MPSFDLTDANAGAVAQICRRLDGLPLAIELAAARVRVLPPEQLASRLDSAFHALGSGSRGAMPRHRTLRAVMDWSHALLSEPERLLLRRLSVFAGGFTLEAAEDVCSADSLRADDVLDLVAALVDRSLVLMRESGGRARYHLLETVRQYAAARLLEAGEEHDLGRRHAEHFIALADEAEPHLTTTGRRIWFERLTEEADNLRQGLAWTRDHAPAQHVRLAGLLCWFWFSSREWLEGRRWLEGAMAMTEAAPGTRVRAQVLFAAGVLATLQAQTALAEPWLEESAATAEAIGDRRLEAYARNYLGLSLVQRGRPEGEIPIRAALWWLREAGDLYGMRLSYLLLASLGMARGELEVAMEDAAEGVRIARLFGQDRELGIALQVLGSVQLMRGDLPAARATLRESLAALHRDPMYLFLARGLDTLARVGFARGEWGEGVRLSGAAAAIRTTIGAEAFALDRASLDEHLAAARAALGEEAFERARAEGGALGLDGAITHALAESARVAEGSDPAARSAAEAGRAEAPAPVVAPDVPPAAGGPGAAGAPTAATSRRDVADPGSAESVSEDRGPAAGHGVGDGIDVRALGPLHITRGARAEAIEWAYARPRELFLYLLSHPEGRTREQIGVVFWPEASAAQVKNSFHVTLHHLRRSLGGADCVLFEDERYRISPAMDVRFDVRTFEDGVAAALRRARSDEPLDALRDALTLYRGHFLSAAGAGDWHLEIHDRLVRLAIDGHVALGGMLVGREEWREAAGVYERLLRIDDLNEEAARGLMLCLARTGQRARALQQYERFVDRLREEIGAEPEPDSTRLAESIRLGASLQAP